MDHNEALLQACQEAKVKYKDVFKRGRPSPLNLQIRKRAEEIMTGGKEELSKRIKEEVQVAIKASKELKEEKNSNENWKDPRVKELLERYVYSPLHSIENFKMDNVPNDVVPEFIKKDFKNERAS